MFPLFYSIAEGNTSIPAPTCGVCYILAFGGMKEGADGILQLGKDYLLFTYPIHRKQPPVFPSLFLSRSLPFRFRHAPVRVLRRETPPPDQMYYDRAYFIVPAVDTSKPYRFLAVVMEKTQCDGIATFVMRSKEYLVTILAENGLLVRRSGWGGMKRSSRRPMTLSMTKLSTGL